MVNALRRRLPMATRADADELLDSGELTPDEVDANLADLARLNRLPGGVSASMSAIARLAGRDGADVLDVGTGAGDMPLAFARRGWRTTAIDTNPQVLRVARRVAAGTDLVEVLEADARNLPFADGSFDVAHCSLLVHHLAPDEAIAVLREMRRVARHGVVVNDLRRGLLPLVATGASVVVLGRSRVTRTDGIASARRAYTMNELDELLTGAGLRSAWRSISWMPRVVTAAVTR
jgi:ubiquinone/menaquinone biosynthesis C-methylase UbiE